MSDPTVELAAAPESSKRVPPRHYRRAADGTLFIRCPAGCLPIQAFQPGTVAVKASGWVTPLWRCTCGLAGRLQLLGWRA